MDLHFQAIRRNYIFNWMFFIAIFSSCGFPGPVISYNKKSKTVTTDSSITEITGSDYLCIGHGMNLQCKKFKHITTDPVTGVVLEIEVSRNTGGEMRDGWKKIKTKTITFDKSGKQLSKTKSTLQTYGRYGIETRFRMVEYLPNGKKRITVKKNGNRWHQNVNKLTK